MNTIVNALISLMSNPTTSGVLLAALIGSNALMYSENSELEKSNAVIEQQLSTMAEQLKIMVKAQANYLATEQAKQVRQQAASDDARRRSDEFFKRRSKEFAELEWWRPREKNYDLAPLKSAEPK